MRRLITIAACALAAITLPGVAAASVNQFVDTWTDEPTFTYNGEFCGGLTVAGYGTESGMARITETSNGGFHMTGYAEGTVSLYEASGPPWDVTFGAFVGTLSYTAHFDEQIGPDGQGTEGGVGGGWIVYADGSSHYYQVLFRLVLQKDGPPKLFLVKIVCGGIK